MRCFTEEMARFVDNYPEYKKMQGNVSKHATLVTEMSKLVEARRLMLVSQTEQDLACNGGQGAAYEVLNAPFIGCLHGKITCCIQRSDLSVANMQKV